MIKQQGLERRELREGWATVTYVALMISEDSYPVKIALFILYVFVMLSLTGVQTHTGLEVRHT